MKLQPKVTKKMILLPPNVMIDSNVNVKTELEDIMTEEEFMEPLCEINVDEFEPLPTDNEEQIEISNWIKRCKQQVLFETDEGRPFVKCPACHATFFKAVSFQRHLPSHLCKSYDGSLYVCNFCKFEDKDGCTVFKHLVVHQDQCEVNRLRWCEAMFVKLSNYLLDFYEFWSLSFIFFFWECFLVF